ncbi:MAG TPA: TolC family protein [Candidatus Dormibacteraeota bacterium]|nr:TolC family protein [Candidatus Dormibacteraeota bacterium]
MKIISISPRYCLWTLICSVPLLGLAAPSFAQTRVSLQDAIRKALDSRASLKAEAARVSAAEGLEKQAHFFANPIFQFENENLHPGQTYSRDVDTYAFFTQPIDVLGKRKERIEVAERAVGRTEADYELAQRQVVQSVKLAYWAARGAQENRDLLNATVANFQRIVDYNSAQLSVGAISEQDLLRVQLEGERLNITARLAGIEVTRTRVELLRQTGQIDFAEVVLTEPLDAEKTDLDTLELQQVLDQRAEVKVARAALQEAEANSRLQDVSARPDLDLIYGFKRTQLVDATTGVNTAVAGVRMTLPIMDRNQGNRAAAGAEVRRQQQLLEAAEASVRADYYSALQEYELRRTEVVETLQPLRQHAANISQIAQAAYIQGGTDLLRLLDAERARLDAGLAYVSGMVEYQQSIANLQAAEGATQ